MSSFVSEGWAGVPAFPHPGALYRQWGSSRAFPPREQAQGHHTSKQLRDSPSVHDSGAQIQLTPTLSPPPLPSLPSWTLSCPPNTPARHSQGLLRGWVGFYPHWSSPASQSCCPTATHTHGFSSGHFLPWCWRPPSCSGPCPPSLVKPRGRCWVRAHPDDSLHLHHACDASAQ